MVLNSEDLAWAAGFLEADGCFNVHKAKTRTGRYTNRVVIVAVNSDHKLLEFFKDLFFGWGIVRQKQAANFVDNRGIKYTKATYEWRVAAKQARIVCQLIFPYIKGVKRRKILDNAHDWRVSPDYTQGKITPVSPPTEAKPTQGDDA